MSTDLAEYYRSRAPEYEVIYFRPDAARLFELEEQARAVRSWLAGRDVLEVAAGTGWWTVHAASVANSITATDINEETLAIAKTKPLEKVNFQIADAFALDQVPGTFNGFLACFWLSHVSRKRLKEFLIGVYNRLEPGSRVFMADNNYDPNLGGRFVQEPGNPDTYRLREDKHGEEHKVLKNYYSREELEDLTQGMDNIQIHMGFHYWWIMYEKPSSNKPA